MKSSFANPLHRLLQQLNSLLIRSVAIALQINQPPAISAPHSLFVCFVYFVVPCRRSVGGDDAFAALEGFGDDESEVVGEGWKNENIAPVPDFLELFAEGG